MTSGVATIYFVWMLYNDWQPRQQLHGIRQLSWSLLHFPFHLVLILFVGGAAQFIMRWKIIEVTNAFASKENLIAYDVPIDLNNPYFFTIGNVTKDQLLSNLNSTAGHIFDLYPPRSFYTYIDITQLALMLDNISDSFWNNINNPLEWNLTINKEESLLFLQTMSSIDLTVTNSIFATFGIDWDSDTNYTGGDPINFETNMFLQNRSHLDLVVSIPTCP